MQKETLKLSNIKKDLELVAFCNIYNKEDWKLYPAMSIVAFAVLIGYFLKTFWTVVAIPFAIPYLISYIKDRIKYSSQKKELSDTLDRGDVSITLLKLSHIAKETIYEPHTHRRTMGRHSHRHSTKTVTFFHFISGSSWRVPNVLKHYEWSNKYYLSKEGLENISLAGNEFYYITLQGHSEVSYIYPCKYFELDGELKVKE